MSITTIEKASSPTVLVSANENGGMIGLHDSVKPFTKPPSSGRYPVAVSQAAVRRVAPDQLRPHPAKLEIYGDQPGGDFVGSIREHGVLEPLVVTPQNLIISGHLRHAASVAAGLSEVPVITVEPADDEVAIDLLLNANIQRVKTNEQIVREAASRMRIEARKAQMRQAAGTAAKVPAKSPEGRGDARAIVAKQMAIGVKKVDQCVAIVGKLAELQQEGDQATYNVLSNALAKSINKAASKVVVLNERAKHTKASPLSQTTEVVPSTAVVKADLITRLQDNVADGLERWTTQALLDFEKALAAFKADWFTTHGEEEA